MAYTHLPDEWSRTKSFFPLGGTIDPISVSHTGNSLIFKRSWKLIAVYCFAGILLGPLLMISEGRDLYRNGLDQYVQQWGYYFACGIAVANLGGWFLLFYALLSRKFMRVDFAAELVEMESRFLRMNHRTIAFSDIYDVDLDFLIRREDRSSSISPDNLKTTYALSLHLNSGDKIRVFETPNQEVAKASLALIEEVLRDSKGRFGQRTDATQS